MISQFEYINQTYIEYMISYDRSTHTLNHAKLNILKTIQVIKKKHYKTFQGMIMNRDCSI